VTKHYNPSIVERANRILASKSGDFLPDDVAGPVATIAITPVSRVLGTINANTSSATNTIVTLPSDKDTYLTGYMYSLTTDASFDGSGIASINVRINGVVVDIARIGLLTLTAQNREVVVMFPQPIKLDRTISGLSSLIALAQPTFTAGSFLRQGVIFGYTEEVTR